jgi:plasmid stabilization system protein ParE
MTWGPEQRDRYDQILEEAFDRLREFPDLGLPVPGKPSSIREMILEHHIIQYRREAERVVILRIVGHRQRRR